jgi:transcription-repair coupling factor (superfamily II helicase)
MGYQLYMELLQRAIEELQSPQTKISSSSITCDIQCTIATLLPESYMPDIPTRLSFYQRLDASKTKTAVHQLCAELCDRFGPLPAQAKNLFAVKELQLDAQTLGIEKIRSDNHATRLYFSPHTTIEPQQLIQYTQKKPHLYRLIPPNQFMITNAQDPLTRCQECLKTLRA